MAIGVIEEACEFAPDMSKGRIVIESDHEQGEFDKAFHELTTMEARNEAIRFAAQRGMGAARIGGNTDGPYPVNADGVPTDLVVGDDGKPLPQQHPKKQPSRYRIEIPVTRPMGV